MVLKYWYGKSQSLKVSGVLKVTAFALSVKLLYISTVYSYTLFGKGRCLDVSDAISKKFLNIFQHKNLCICPTSVPHSTEWVNMGLTDCTAAWMADSLVTWTAVWLTAQLQAWQADKLIIRLTGWLPGYSAAVFPTDGAGWLTGCMLA